MANLLLFQCDQDYNLLTVRKIESPGEIHLEAHVLLETGRIVTDVFVEGSRVVIGCLVEDADSNAFEIQIRNLADLALVKCITQSADEHCQVLHPRMDCKNGRIAVAMNGFFRLIIYYHCGKAGRISTEVNLDAIFYI